MPAPSETIICGDCLKAEPCRCPRVATGNKAGNSPPSQPENIFDKLRNPAFLRALETPAGKIGAFIGVLFLGIDRYAQHQNERAQLPEDQGNDFVECSFCDKESVGYTVNKKGQRVEVCRSHARKLR